MNSSAVDAADYIRSRRHISYADVLEVHRILFSGVYPWAGQDRLETAPHLNITKSGYDNLFAQPNEIRMAMDHGLRMASNPDTIRAKPGEIMGYMAYSHPFLDGNGRTIMTLHQEMCRRAGFHIEWMTTDKRNYLTILTQEELQYPGKGFLDDYLKPKIINKPLDLKTTVKTLLEIRGLNRDVTPSDESYVPPSPRF